MFVSSTLNMLATLLKIIQHYFVMGTVLSTGDVWVHLWDYREVGKSFLYNVLLDTRVVSTECFRNTQGLGEE